MSSVHTSWTTFIGLSGVDYLSGSSIWNQLEYIYGVLSAYWNDDDQAQNYIVTNAPVTALSALCAASGGVTPSALTCGVDYTLGSAGVGYIVNIISGQDADILGYQVFEDGAGASWRFGYNTGDASGNPSSPLNNSPSLLSQAWYRSSISTGTTYTNLLRSAHSAAMPGTSSFVSGINNIIWSTATDTMTGTEGWNNRFFQPYLGFKQLIKLYDDAQYSSAGITATIEGPSALGPTSSLVPLSSMSGDEFLSAYYYAYDDVAQYVWAWATITNYLESVSSVFSQYNDKVHGVATTGSWFMNKFTSAGSASNQAADLFVQDGNDNSRKFIFTGPDSDPRNAFFRQTNEVAGLRLQWDKDNVFIPISSYSGTSAAIWDTPTKDVMMYLTKPLTAYDVVREVISGF